MERRAVLSKITPQGSASKALRSWDIPNSGLNPCIPAFIMSDTHPLSFLLAALLVLILLLGESKYFLAGSRSVLFILPDWIAVNDERFDFLLLADLPSSA